MGELQMKNTETDQLKPLHLIDPVVYADLLNTTASEVLTDEITSAETRFVIDELLRIAAGKDKEGGAQMVGLAAPQIGVGKRIAIVDVAATGMRREQEMVTFINPRIVEYSKHIVDGREGCWSCGEYHANVPRADWIEVEAVDSEMNKILTRFDGFTARIIQHEIDHLNGIRCIDRVPAEEPWRLHRVVREDIDEFNRYRREWSQWTKTFPRSEWIQFHDGVDPNIKITGEKTGKYQLFSAEYNGMVAGSVKLAPSAIHEPELVAMYPDTATVYQLFTDRRYRGQGIGTRLMDVVEEIAQQQGAPQVILGVVADNVIARKMYEARGYDYIAVGDKRVIDSVWDIDGKVEVAQVMPMMKKMKALL